MTNTTWRVFDEFVMPGSLGIASSHLTANVAALRQLARLSPAFVVLKTTSEQLGGNGKGRRNLLQVGEHDIYTDGPKTLELLNLATTHQLLEAAKIILPHTRLGISILMGEDYSACAQNLLALEPHFAEMNLKYSVRPSDSTIGHSTSTIVSMQFAQVLKEIKKFCEAFESIPIFIKLTREMVWLENPNDIQHLLKPLQQHGRAGLVVANTTKYTVPPSSSPTSKELVDGVRAGKSLFDRTYQIIRALRPFTYPKSIPIIASGGIFSIEQIVDILKAGASAVQLCTALQLYGFDYFTSLQEQLQHLIAKANASNYDGFLDQLHSKGTLIFTQSLLDYHSRFYDYDFGTMFAMAKHLDIMNIYGRSWLCQGNLEELRSKLLQSGFALRLLMMSMESPYLPLLAEHWGRNEHVLRVNMQYVRELITTNLMTSKHHDSTLEVLEHSRCPFFSLYISDRTALYIPYSLGLPTRELPIYEFRKGSEEYARLCKQFNEMVYHSKPALEGIIDYA